MHTRYAAHPASTGASSRRRLSVATGPKSQVTGARMNAGPGTVTAHVRSRLPGAVRTFVWNGLRPWASACDIHCSDQMK